MGLPIKHRKKYVSHKQRWNKQTILDEEILVKNYALKNKKEIKKAEFLISKLKKIAKELNKDEETKTSQKAIAFIESLKKKGFLNLEATTLDEVLDITLKDILERRLSNIIYKLKLARTPIQARQFVVHRHIKVENKVISSPSYLTSLKEEAMISFLETSSLFNEDHPERKNTIEGIEEELKEQDLRKDIAEKNPKKGPNFDKLESKFDDEELDEVNK